MPANDNLLKLTADIVSAHAASQRISAGELSGLIQLIYTALGATGIIRAEPRALPKPAVPIEQSVFPDYIICLEDGKKMKMLKRYLATAYGMSVDDYRAKWRLPRSYPMVAPNYTTHRSALAKQFGLGKKTEIASEEPVIRRIPEKYSGQSKRRVA